MSKGGTMGYPPLFVGDVFISVSAGEKLSRLRQCGM
jgi:hypothetical protein